MGLQVDDGGAETSQTVGKVGGEFRRDDLVTSTVLWQVLIRLQVKDGVFGGIGEQLVNVPIVSLYAYQMKKVRWVRKNHDKPRPS